MGHVEPGSMRLRDFTKDSLARTGDQIRESTRCETESAMRDFIGTIGNIDFRNVSLAHGEQYLQTCLDRGNTKATVAKKLRHIKRVFKLAVNRKQLDETRCSILLCRSHLRRRSMFIPIPNAEGFRKLPKNVPTNGIPKDRSNGI